MSSAPRAAALFLAAVCATAMLAAVLPLRDPAAQPDGLVLRRLPPGSRVDAVRLSDGSLRYADAVRPLPGGGVRMLRGQRWTSIDPDRLAGPNREQWHLRPLYPLGTDGFGRDLLSRLVFGARVSLAVGLLAAALAVGVGAVVGLAAGLAGGAVDGLLMRATDFALSIPRLFLLVFLVALYRPSIATTVLVIGATSWMTAARLVRGEILSLRTTAWVDAARGSGASPARVALVHLLPATASILAVEGALRLGQAILLEASLSFLGLGVPPPAPSWGNIVADGRTHLLGAWWIATLPGLLIAATVLAASVLGDGLRDVRERRVSERRT